MKEDEVKAFLRRLNELLELLPADSRFNEAREYARALKASVAEASIGKEDPGIKLAKKLHMQAIEDYTSLKIRRVLKECDAELFKLISDE